MPYRLVVLERPADGLAVLDCGGDQALWARSRLRKPAKCALTDAQLPTGALAYRPVGNQQYRALRAAATAVEAARVSVVHAWGGGPTLACCGQRMAYRPADDRVTTNPDRVTCTGPLRPQQ